METVHATPLLAVLQATALTVAPSANDNCPTSAQVLAALETHASDLVTPRPYDDPTKTLVLHLMPPLSSGETSFSLLDKTGLVKLYRTLPAPAGDRARDCVALADTVAFIVVRYFEEVELPNLPERKPPPPTPPPPPPQPPPKPVPAKEAVGRVPAKLTLSLNGGRRFPGEAFNLGGFEVKVILGAALADLGKRGGDLWLEGAAGFAGHATYYYNTPSSNHEPATSDRVAADLGLLAGWRGQHHSLHAGPVASVELIWIETSPTGNAQSYTLVGAAAGIKIGYQYFASGRLFARADAAGNLALVKQEAVTQSAGQQVFSAPRTYLTFAIGAGIWF